MKLKFREWDTDVIFLKYGEGSTAIRLVDSETSEPLASATVWIPGLIGNEVAVKDYSENEGMLEALVDAGIVAEPHRFVASGFVTIPVCMLLKVKDHDDE